MWNTQLEKMFVLLTLQKNEARRYKWTERENHDPWKKKRKEGRRNVCHPPFPDDPNGEKGKSGTISSTSCSIVGPAAASLL